MKYISVDTETTGLNPEQNNILEFCAILDDGSEDINSLPIFHAIIPQPYYLVDIYCAQLHYRLWPYLNEAQQCFKELSIGESKESEANPNVRYYLTQPLRLLITGLYHHSVHACATYEHLKQAFNQWRQFYGAEKLSAAGKNFGSFDKPFLDKIGIKFPHRHIDPTYHYIDWDNDTLPPDLKTCLKRAGKAEIVMHCAYYDAMDIIKLIRHSRNK